MDTITHTESNGSPRASKGAVARNVGRIEEIQGVVIEAVFPERLPEINHAITIAGPRSRGRGGGDGVSARRARRARLRGAAAPR